MQSVVVFIIRFIRTIRVRLSVTALGKRIRIIRIIYPTNMNNPHSFPIHFMINSFHNFCILNTDEAVLPDFPLLCRFQKSPISSAFFAPWWKRTKKEPIFFLFSRLLFCKFVCAEQKNGSQSSDFQYKCLSLWRHAEKGMSSRESFSLRLAWKLDISKWMRRKFEGVLLFDVSLFPLLLLRRSWLGDIPIGVSRSFILFIHR